MDHYTPLQNSESITDNGFNSYLQPPTNVIQMGQPSSNDFYDTDYFSETDNIPPYTNMTTTSNYDQQFMPSANNGHVLAPQYASLNVNEQNPSQFTPSIFSPSIPSILNSPQTNGIFRFEIPGFKIIIIPTSPPVVNFDNLNMSTQLRQDLNDSSIVADNLQPQFQQQNSLNLNDSQLQQDLNDSSTVADNLQPRFQQPNSLDLNESFYTFVNCG